MADTNTGVSDKAAIASAVFAGLSFVSALYFSIRSLLASSQLRKDHDQLRDEFDKQQGRFWVLKDFVVQQLVEQGGILRKIDAFDGLLTDVRDLRGRLPTITESGNDGINVKVARIEVSLQQAGGDIRVLQTRSNKFERLRGRMDEFGRQRAENDRRKDDEIAALRAERDQLRERLRLSNINNPDSTKSQAPESKQITQK
ncbi:hypothetical protein CSOJ01_05804 [Colletotrichum sojae]|uniref:Uncharacterized protein n=1 Tax=Colletotrichum sojae TaxID=2175907 RepID=A0A8H6MWX5_9PEZI|nr:hypothetical protein CSOJ01_05804 [Colletotrichum sojae]